MCVGLESAALRGVDVKIILPGIPDKKIVYAIGKTYILRLQKAGIKVYKYKKGFIHAKTYLSDDEYCMIGTVNLDYRSLAHHFENGVLLYKDPSVKNIKSDLEKTLNESVKFSEKELKGGVIKRFFVSIIKIFAPLF